MEKPKSSLLGPKGYILFRGFYIPENPENKVAVKKNLELKCEREIEIGMKELKNALKWIGSKNLVETYEWGIDIYDLESEIRLGIVAGKFTFCGDKVREKYIFPIGPINFRRKWLENHFLSINFPEALNVLNNAYDGIKSSSTRYDKLVIIEGCVEKLPFLI